MSSLSFFPFSVSRFIVILRAEKTFIDFPAHFLCCFFLRFECLIHLDFILVLSVREGANFYFSKWPASRPNTVRLKTTEKPFPGFEETTLPARFKLACLPGTKDPSSPGFRGPSVPPDPIGRGEGKGVEWIFRS